MTDSEIFQDMEQILVGFPGCEDPLSLAKSSDTEWSKENGGRWSSKYKKCPICGAWIIRKSTDHDCFDTI